LDVAADESSGSGFFSGFLTQVFMQECASELALTNSVEICHTLPHFCGFADAAALVSGNTDSVSVVVTSNINEGVEKWNYKVDITIIR